MNLETITKADLIQNYSLYSKLLKVFEIVDGKQPDGTCCGRGKESAIDLFINNRDKYVSGMKEISERKIKPLFTGSLYFTKVGKRFNAERLTDKISLYLIENGYERFFDTSDYVEEETNVEIVQEVKKVTTRKKATRRKKRAAAKKSNKQ